MLAADIGRRAKELAPASNKCEDRKPACSTRRAAAKIARHIAARVHPARSQARTAPISQWAVSFSYSSSCPYVIARLYRFRNLRITKVCARSRHAREWKSAESTSDRKSVRVGKE